MAFDYTRAPMKRARSLVWIVIAAALARVRLGTKKPPVGTLEPDKFLWERGTEELNKKHWLTSREYFRQLMDSYPQSQYRADAKLGLADTYLGEGSAESSVLAVNEYREFLSFYPTHRRAYYAQFKLGMCHFYQMHGPIGIRPKPRGDRRVDDVRHRIASIRTTRRETHARSAEGARAAARSPRSAERRRLPRRRTSTSKTQKFPPAAIDRFKAILKNDPEYSRRDARVFLPRAGTDQDEAHGRGASPSRSSRRANSNRANTSNRRRNSWKP